MYAVYPYIIGYWRFKRDFEFFEGTALATESREAEALEETEGEMEAAPSADVAVSSSDPSSSRTVASAAVQKKVTPAMPSATTSRSGPSPATELLNGSECNEPEPEPELLLVASLVEKHANLGGLCRTCEAFGLSLALAHTPELLRAPDFLDPFHTDALELPDEQLEAASREAAKVAEDYGNGLPSADGDSKLPIITSIAAGDSTAAHCENAKSNASSSRKKRSKATGKSRHKPKEESATSAAGGDEDVTGAVAFRALSVSRENWLRYAGRLVDLRRDRLRAFLQARRAKAYHVIALEQTDRSVPLPSYQFPPRCVLLLGCVYISLSVDMIDSII